MRPAIVSRKVARVEQHLGAHQRRLAHSLLLDSHLADLGVPLAMNPRITGYLLIPGNPTYCPVSRLGEPKTQRV